MHDINDHIYVNWNWNKTYLTINTIYIYACMCILIALQIFLRLSINIIVLSSRILTYHGAITCMWRVILQCNRLWLDLPQGRSDWERCKCSHSWKCLPTASNCDMRTETYLMWRQKYTSYSWYYVFFYKTCST